MPKSSLSSKHPSSITVALLLLLSCTSGLRAQVVFNEIFENPPGHSRQEVGWEYIELYGAPGTKLDGLAILVLKGGRDDNRDGVPELFPHLDEVFVLDGCALSSDGFFTLVGSSNDGHSPIRMRCLEYSPPAEVRDHVRQFSDTYPIQSSNRSISSRLDNHGSSTYLLVYIDPEDTARHNLIPGALIDNDFNSELDTFLTVDDQKLKWPTMQVLDEVAWSHKGGKEYTVLEDHEITETTGLNPDCISRIRYYPGNPMRGHRTKDVLSSRGEMVRFEVRSTTTADESYIFGVLNTEYFPDRLVYFDGYDLQGWNQLRGPTDRSRTPYGNLSADPEPDQNPFPGFVPRDPAGSLYFDDMRPVSFTLTPGSFNDSASNNIRQHRFLPGDANFDGKLDQSDLDLTRALIGAELHEQLPSEAGFRFQWQCEAAQQILAIRSLFASPTLAGAITREHLQRLEELIQQAAE